MRHNRLFRSTLLLSAVVSLLLLSTKGASAQVITQANVSSLREVWKHSIGSAITAAPVVVRPSSPNYPLNVESLFVGAANGTFYALNANDGAILWTVQTGGAISLPAAIVPGVNNGVNVVFASANGCVYSANANNGALEWQRCYSPSSTNLVAIGWSVGPGVTVTRNSTGGGGGAIDMLDEQSGSPEWTYTSPQNFVASTPAGAGYGQILAATTSTFLTINPAGGSLIGSVSIPGSPVSAPLPLKAGVLQNAEPLFPGCTAINTVTWYAVLAIGHSLYISHLSSTGPGSLSTLGLSANVAAGPALWFENFASTRIMRLPSGLLVSCLTTSESDDTFFPLVSGYISAGYVGVGGGIVANGSEAANASPKSLLWMYDFSNPYNTTGMVFAASGSELKAVLVPSGTIDNVFSAQANLNGAASDMYSTSAPERIYLTDKSGNIYALSSTGQ